MVRNMTPMTMAQEKEEGFRTFFHRLRDQVKDCKSWENCSQNPFEAVTYTDIRH